MNHLAPRWIALCLAVVGAAGCGEDSSAAADASPDARADASSERMDVAINGTTLCPIGFTEELSATLEEGANRIVLRAGCDEEIEELLIIFSPIPSAGEMAPCTQATFRDSEASLSCRAGNAVIPEPAGMLEQVGDIVSGRCECVGEAGTAAATFRLTLQ